MKILIVDCLSVGEGRRRFSRDFIGGGPKLIAGVLNQTRIKDLFIKIHRAEEILFDNGDNLKQYNLCLISAMSMDFKSVERIVKKWRNVNKNKLLIIGGPITSDSTIIEKLEIDLLVQCEGEQKLILIINILILHHLKINEIAQEKLLKVDGIVFRYANKIFKTNSSKFLSREDYNKYSNPDLYLKNVKNYNNYKSARIYVECVRGCSNYYRTRFPLNKNRHCIETCNNCKEGDLKNRINCPANIPPGCGFCSTITFFGFPRSRDMNNILLEIEGLLNIGSRRIVLGGSDFLDYYREFLVKDNILTTPSIPPEPNYEALEQIINRIIKLEQIKLCKAQIFIENVKASLCTDRALKILSRIPNIIFSVGCETGSEEFARNLGRPFYPSDVLKAIKKAILLGIRVQVYLIHSLPGEKIEYIKESIELIDKLYKMGVEKITIYKYHEFPGCPFFLLQDKKQLLNQTNKKLIQYRKKLVKRAINFNRSRKEEMLEKSYEIILAETSFFNKKDAIGYIIRGGPKVLVKNASDKIEDVVNVNINKVLSDKLVEGSIIQ